MTMSWVWMIRTPPPPTWKVERSRRCNTKRRTYKVRQKYFFYDSKTIEFSQPATIVWPKGIFMHVRLRRHWFKNSWKYSYAVKTFLSHKNTILDCSWLQLTAFSVKQASGSITIERFKCSIYSTRNYDEFCKANQPWANPEVRFFTRPTRHPNALYYTSKSLAIL